MSETPNVTWMYLPVRALWLSSTGEDIEALDDPLDAEAALRKLRQVRDAFDGGDEEWSLVAVVDDAAMHKAPARDLERELAAVTRDWLKAREDSEWWKRNCAAASEIENDLVIERDALRAEVERLKSELTDAKRSAHAAYLELSVECDSFRAEVERLRDAKWKAMETGVNAVRDAEALRAEVERLTLAKDGAYEERNRCVALIARMALALGCRAGLARTAIEGWSEDWHGCVFIDLPTGQVSWHYHDSHAHLFAGLPQYAGSWDGHDTPEKYRRVGAARQFQSAEVERLLMLKRARETATAPLVTERNTLRAQVERLREALLELVTVKSMKDSGELSGMEYTIRKTAAWSVARAALSPAEEPK